MAEQSKSERRAPGLGANGTSVDALATKALSLVAERNTKNIQQIDTGFDARLHDAAAGISAEAVQTVVDDMLAAGITPEVIADLYIPASARRMGDEWCEDTLSFARVTIGTARLQAALRALGDTWSSHGYAEENEGASAVVVIVVKDAFHTLGSVVLCGQLRRLGLSVRLAMGVGPAELRTILQATNFDAALISASESETLDSLAEIVDVIRQSASVCPPIVIGGSVLDQEADVRALTGADHVTKDPIEALELCGLTKIKRPKTPAQKQRV